MLIVLFAALTGCVDSHNPDVDPEDFAMLWAEFGLSGEYLQQTPQTPVLLSQFGIAQLAEPGTTTEVTTLGVPLYEAPYPCQNGTGFQDAREDVMSGIDSCVILSHSGRTISSVFEIDVQGNLIIFNDMRLEISSTTPYDVEVWCYVEPSMQSQCIASDIPWYIRGDSEFNGERIQLGYFPASGNSSNGTVTAWSRILPAPQ